jgi:hypothetical protein
MTKTQNSKPVRPFLNAWPWAIVLTFVLFISGTVSLVVMACSQKVDLVSANYYEQELQFQGQLDRLNRTQRLGAPATVSYDPARKAITFRLPPEHQDRKVTGRLDLYRPSASGQDRQLALLTDNRGMQTIDAANLGAGLWKVRVTWQVDGKEYFVEQQVVIGSKS